MSPSGPPVMAYCILADAPGRSGWLSAILCASSSHSCVRYLGMRASSPSMTCADLTDIDGRPQAREQIGLGLARGDIGVDVRAGEHVLLPREHLAHRVVGQAHPEALRFDLGAVGQQRRPPAVEVVAHV